MKKLEIKEVENIYSLRFLDDPTKVGITFDSLDEAREYIDAMELTQDEYKLIPRTKSYEIEFITVHDRDEAELIKDILEVFNLPIEEMEDYSASQVDNVIDAVTGAVELLKNVETANHLLNLASRAKAL